MDYARHVVKAIIARMGQIAAFNTAVSGRIYSDVLQSSNFPYAVVSLTSDQFSAQSFAGQQHTVRVQIFSQEKSIAEVLTLRALLIDGLDRAEPQIPPLDAGTLVKCEHTGVADAFKEDDGKTWQAIAEFDVITH